MARPEPFPIGILRPRGNEREAPALRFTLAATLEEPALRFGLPQGYLTKLLDPKVPLTREQMQVEALFESTGSTGIVIARTTVTTIEGDRQTVRDAYAIFCRWSLKAVKELEQLSIEEPPEAYIDHLRRDQIMVDPLLLAQPGLRPDQLTPLATLGTSALVETFPDGGQIELRVVSDAAEIKRIQKLLGGGLFGGLPDPMLLDGPYGFARWQARTGHDLAFACIVPVGDGMSELTLNELLVMRNAPLEVNAIADSAEAASDGEVPLPESALRIRNWLRTPLELPKELVLRRYPYSSPEAREYASQDWGEDLKLEGEVSDTSALLARGFDEYFMVAGECNRAPRAVDHLYDPATFGAECVLEVQPWHIRAARAFKRAGDASALDVLVPDSPEAPEPRVMPDLAVWTPRRDGSDLTHRLLTRRPPARLRRAMIGVQPYVPLGYVVQMGL